MILVIFWIIEAFLILNSIGVTFTTNFTVGKLMLYTLTVLLFLLLIFHKPIGAFTAHGIGLWLKAIFFACVIIALCLVTFVAVSGYANKPKYNEKTVIVLGAGLRGEKVSDVLKRRLDATVLYYEKNSDINIVVTGGQGNGETIAEAVAMQKYLVAKGVPTDKIIIEDKSTSTKENLLFSKRKLEEKGISINDGTVIVTNAFHCYRAGCYAEKAGFKNVRCLPASISVTAIVSCYLREALAVVWLWVVE